MPRLLVLALIAFAPLACAEASGERQGGEPTIDPTVPNPRPEELLDTGSGSRWSDLYRDLFGPGSYARCSQASCHGLPDGGGVVGGGIECFDAAGCRASVIDTLVRMPEDQAAPESSALVAVLRHRDGTGKTIGIMPARPPDLHFNKAAIARVEEWLRAGAPDD